MFWRYLGCYEIWVVKLKKLVMIIKKQKGGKMKRGLVVLVLLVSGVLLGEVAWEHCILPVNSWYATVPISGENIYYDPTSGVVEIVYIPTPYDAHALYFAYSEDHGVSWEEMGPIDMGYGAQYPSIAAAADNTPYITFIDDDGELRFTRDEGFLYGLWWDPIPLTDTLDEYSMRFGSIAVSGDGQFVVIAAQGNYARNDTNVRDILFFRSLDGGTTWEPMRVIAYGDSFTNPREPLHLAESPTVYMSSDCKNIVVTFGSIPPVGDGWCMGIVVSTDSGVTWRQAKHFPLVEGATWAWENWWSRHPRGVMVDDDVFYCFAYQDKMGCNRLVGFRYRISTDTWEDYWFIAPPRTDIAYGEATLATMGKDALGRIFVAVQDWYDPAPYDYGIFVFGSDNAGDYWTAPMLVSEGVAGADTGRTMTCEMAENVGDGLIIYNPMGWWESFEDSLRLVHFEPDSLFVPAMTTPKVMSTPYGNTYDVVGPYVITAEIRDNNLTAATLTYATATETTTVDMTNIGGANYQAEIPGYPVDTRIEYYIKAEDADANVVYMPGTAPDVGCAILVLPNTVIRYDDGVPAYNITNPWGDGFISRMFEPFATPETLYSVWVYIDSMPDTFYLHLHPDDGTGKPTDEDLIDPIEVVPTDTGWVEIPIPGNFVLDDIVHARIEFKFGDRPYIGADEYMDSDNDWICYQWWWWGRPSVFGIGDYLIYAVTSPYVGVEEQVPIICRLAQNVPNPVTDVTHIAFTISKEAHVKLCIYNMLGQRVRTLVDYKLPPGTHDVTWNGTDDEGKLLPAGVYFYTLKVGDWSATKKLLLLH